MVAWGPGTSGWDDSVDEANLEAFAFGDIPNESFVMTSWHEGDPMKEAFWFSKNNASHPIVEIENTVLVHLSEVDRGTELKVAYDNA